MLLYKLIILLALIVSSAWAINNPGYDSIASVIGCLAAFVVVYFIDKKKSSNGQSLEVSQGGIGIQAGRDANNAKINKK